MLDGFDDPVGVLALDVQGECFFQCQLSYRLASKALLADRAVKPATAS
jgi:hypothetical protein